MNEIESVNTSEDAIAWLEETLSDGKCSDRCPQCNTYEFALAALRAQAERMKGCEYCVEDYTKESYVKFFSDREQGRDDRYYGIGVWIENQHLSIVALADERSLCISKDIPSNYCLNCGRKLSEGST